jgi:hypothetical protein
MKDRLVTYGIILLVYYIGLYIWDQKGEVEYLKEGVKEQKEYMTKQEETIKAQNDLISTQNEYIRLLEAEYQSPFNNKPRKYYDPI